MQCLYLTSTGAVSAIPIVIITLLISLCSFGFGIYQFVKKSGKEDVHEVRTQTTQDVSRITEIVLKLDHIREDTQEIKSELKGVKQEMNIFRDRLTRAEMKVDSAHQRLDDYFKKIGEMDRIKGTRLRLSEGSSSEE